VTVLGETHDEKAEIEVC